MTHVGALRGPEQICEAAQSEQVMPVGLSLSVSAMQC